MIELYSIDTTLIPVDCFIMSWTHLKLIAGGSFSLGFLLKYGIDKIKARGL